MEKLILFFTCCFLFHSCLSQAEKEKKEQVMGLTSPDSANTQSTFKTSSLPSYQTISAFIPQGYVLYDQEGMAAIKGDLNKDGREDLILMIKKVDKNNIIQHDFRGELDLNRRGIIVLFNKGDHYELAVENYTCFSSENEEGGNYYPPELAVSIENGKLFVHYAHGRYGYWRYTFRNNNGDFDLIGYDASYNRGPVTQYQTSINYLTKKKLTRDNLNKDQRGDDYEENFKEIWEKIELKSLMKLSEIKDFDDLE